MKYRRLGKSDLMVSEVSFGGHQTGSYDGALEVPLAERVKVIERGLELGINYFDTTAEIELDSLTKVFEAMGGQPENTTLAGAYSDYQHLSGDYPEVARDTRRLVSEEIDRRLAYIDPIDVFILCGNGLPYSRERTLGALEALEEARDRGKISHFGFSSHTLDYVVSVIENHPEFCLVMFPYNVVVPKVGDILFPVAGKHDVAVVGMKALAVRGFFDVGIDPRDYGRDLSLAVAAIKWVLQAPEVSCTIPAMNSIGEVEENVRASGAALTAEELSMLEELRVRVEAKLSGDRPWYFRRDWTRRLLGDA